MNNPYVKTLWFDEIVDPITEEIIEEGTPYLAAYANNIEQGIYNAYELIIVQDKEIQRLRVQMEINGRVPGNSGAFFDTLDGYSNKLVSLDEETIVTEAVSAGATTIKVDGGEGFTAFTQVTIYDDVSHEDVLVTAVHADSIEVQALSNSYKRGAVVARSNVVVDTVNKLMINCEWGTFTIEAGEVI
ncbi:hypothetical protein [Heyndrickxia oleronia]|uniref:hypothetical protein n=1 Tax=Heyndrickxia oleronia TaxID=38875 RepID=UPI001C0E9177|nr:hypothetical protein [Heyndrickxia oleronia]MBU5214344.1 hypothetical protein [Heyndrickxia oleronia]